MIEQVITYINTQLATLPFFTENYGLSELKEDNGVRQPVRIIGGVPARLKLNKFGITYIRKTGPVRSSKAVDAYKACSDLIQSVYPITIFALTKRKDFPIETAFASDMLATEIYKLATLTGGPLKNTIGAKALSITPTGYDSDTEAILNREFSNIRPSDFNYSDIVISVSFDITITADLSCIAPICPIPDPEI